MPHRSDLEAAHARIAALERELVAARGPRDRSLTAIPNPVPPGFEVVEQPGRLRISWTVPTEPWPPAARAFLTVSLAVAVVVGFRQDQFLVLCTAGIIAAASLIAWIGDRAVLELSGGRLRVAGSTAAPPDRRPVTSGDIAQLYCVLCHRKGRACYQLWSLMVGGERVCLVAAIDTAERAAFLERELARRLGTGR